MGRVIILIAVFAAMVVGLHGLTEEVENMINLQQNIQSVLEE
jgi:hypothetical protein